MLIGFAAGVLSCYMLMQVDYGDKSGKLQQAPYAYADAGEREQHLIKENQQLRRILALSDKKIQQLLQLPPKQRSEELQGAAVLPHPQSQERQPQQAGSSLPTGKYWLNSSGIRHNDSCRYFRNGRGEHINDQQQGRACRICGG